MLVFGTGLYELFISQLGNARSLSKSNVEHKSNLFGLFPLKVSQSRNFFSTVTCLLGGSYCD